MPTPRRPRPPPSNAKRSPASAPRTRCASSRRADVNAINITYAAPIVAAATEPDAGGDLVTVSGDNFGGRDPSDAACVAAHAYDDVALAVTLFCTADDVSGRHDCSYPCASPAWLSPTSLTCVAPAGLGGGKDVRVALAGQQSADGNAAFSYAPPTAGSLTRAAAAAPGGWKLDGNQLLGIEGASFGTDAAWTARPRCAVRRPRRRRDGGRRGVHRRDVGERQSAHVRHAARKRLCARRHRDDRRSRHAAGQRRARV